MGPAFESAQRKSESKLIFRSGPGSNEEKKGRESFLDFLVLVAYRSPCRACQFRFLA